MKKLCVLLAFVCMSAFAGQPAQGQAPEVACITLGTQNVSLTQKLNGRVTPYLIAEVRPQVNGIILKRLFEEGADVTADQPLYQIDPAMFEAQYQSAVANLAKAKANVALRDATEARYRRLVQAKAVNQQEYDEADAASLQARAEQSVCEAALNIAKINLDYSLVKSPISGRIGRSNITQGALVTANQANPLAVVQQLDPVYVDVTMPVTWMMDLENAIKAGDLKNTGDSHGIMRVRLANGQEYAQTGKIKFAEVTVDQTTGSVTIRAEFPNPDNILLPGLYVEAEIEVGRRENAILVPQRAVFREYDGRPYAFVVTADNSVEKKYIEIARSVGDAWLINSGIDAGTRIIMEGTQRIRMIPGAPAPKVTPVEFKDTK